MIWTDNELNVHLANARYGYIDHLIAICPKPPKDNDRRRNDVRFNERGNRESQKGSENGDDDNKST